jgi:hypothetical protein
MSEDIRPEAVQRIARALRDAFDEGVPAEIAKIVDVDDVDLEPAAAEPQPERMDASVPRRVRMREALTILTRHSDGLGERC